jgi:hypothetical protein
MKILRRVIGLVGLALCLSWQSLYAGVAPVNLQCDFWQNPLGIDDAAPRLSWQLADTTPGERSQAQTAWQIQAASSASLLAAGQPDLWDSGKVVSSQQINLPYGGSALTSGQQVFWQARTWDAQGVASPWSSVNSWTMGVLSPANWQGGWLVPSPASSGFSLTGCSWIWYPEGNPASSAPVATRYFLKNFSVRTDAALTGATLLVTADNTYTAYVNGTQVGSGQDYTTVVPVTVTARLQPGANVLAIAAANTGASANPAGLIGMLVLNYADGTQTNIQMDASWKAANTLQTGWQLPGFNDSAWVSALVLGNYGISPWGTGVGIQTALPIFRRSFTVNPGLQRAQISICGLGQYELSANGVKVGNALLAPNWSKYDQTCLYDTLDLTSYLTNGNNAIGVLLGNGMYNVQATANYDKFTGSFGPPKVIAQIYLYYTNGASQIIPSDAQWQAAAGPITYSHVYGGESYDARLLPANWNQTGYNPANWSAAVVTNGPGGTLRGQSHAAPPIIATQTLLPVQKNTLSSSSIVYDLGQNAALIPTLTTHGPAGSIVQIEPAELTNSDGTINRSSAGGGTAYWQYTLAGTGSETWVPKFFYHGCRYLQVTLTAAPGSTTLPTVDALTGTVIQSSSASAGNFACSSTLFNRTRTLIQWAQRNNLISILTDCPHRERLGWLEQDNLNGPSLRYEFDLGRLFAKSVQDMADSQTDAGTGLVPSIAPEYVVFSGGYRDSPEWGSSVILVPWQQYLFTGDDTLLRNYYGAMTNYFGYLQNQASGNFLSYPNGLGDWYDIGPNAPGYPQNTPVSLTADAYYCQDAQILGQVAAELGNPSDAARFNLLATNIGTAFNSNFYSAANGDYSTGSQTAQAMPLYLGLVSPANQAAVLAELVANVNTQGLTAGEIGHRYLLRALTDMGRPDVVFNLHSGTNGPGYGYILNQGATALTEAWNANPDDSQDHFMLGHITEWFYHDLAGIQWDPAVPGFQHVIIKPAFVGGLTWVSASYNSTRGIITNAWTLTNNLATLNVTIPVGSTGSVYLPILGGLTTNLWVTESGVSLWKMGGVSGASTGVTFAQTQGSGPQTCLVWNVGSGAYQFAWNVFPSPTGLAVVSTNGKVTLSWNGVTNATGYNLKRSVTSGSSYTVVGANVTGTNYTDTSVSNNTTYYYVVSDLEGANESANSAQVSATPVSAATAVVQNFGFETPSISTYQYAPSGATWAFSAQSGANGSGIAANNSAFTSGNPNAPQGVQVAFLQGTGAISQTLLGLLAGALYQISFSAAQRNNIYGQQSGQTWQIWLNGSVIGTYAPPESAQTYSNYTAAFTASASGTNILAFVGTDLNGGDNTVFLDNVQLALAPSLVPPHLSCQIAGGQIQLAWPADHAGWSLQTQTDATGAGLGNNWVTVPGTALTDNFSTAASLTAGSVFFRLVYP